MTAINSTTAQRFYQVPFTVPITFTPRTTGDTYDSDVATRAYRRPSKNGEQGFSPEVLQVADAIFQIVKTSFVPVAEDKITEADGTIYIIKEVNAKLNGSYFLCACIQQVS